MKRASAKTNSEDLKTFSVAKEIKLLRNAYAEKEKLDLECGKETDPNIDEPAVGLKKQNDSEPDGKSVVKDQAQESNSGEMAESDQMPTMVLKKKPNRIVISSEKADEVLLLLDTISIRLVQSKSKFSGKLKEDIAGLQLNIDQVKTLLKDIPPSMSEASRSEFILEVGLHVESIFCCLENLTCKLVECHSQEMCDLVDDLKTGLSSIKAEDYVFNCPPSLRYACKNYCIYEFTFAAVAAFIFCLALFLLTDPVILDVVGKFYDEAFRF